MCYYAVMAPNSRGTAARKPRKPGKGKPFVKDDPRINRAGAPNRGQSWAELIDEMGDKTPSEVRDWAQSIGRKLPKSDVTLKRLAILAAFADCIFEPDARMANRLRVTSDLGSFLPMDWAQSRTSLGVLSPISSMSSAHD